MGSIAPGPGWWWWEGTREEGEAREEGVVEWSVPRARRGRKGRTEKDL
jgi:hypothetical protein